MLASTAEPELGTAQPQLVSNYIHYSHLNPWEDPTPQGSPLTPKKKSDIVHLQVSSCV